MKQELMIQKITPMDTVPKGKDVMLSSQEKKEKESVPCSIERRKINSSSNL